MLWFWMLGATDRKFMGGAIPAAPALIGISVFAIVSGLYVSDPALYLSLMRAVGIPPWRFAFIDSQFMYAARKCWDLGYYVYDGVPCYAIPGKYSYSPLWLRLPFLPSNDAARVPLGMATDVLFILSIATLPTARSLREAALMTMALVSTAVFFALERNNIDVWMFLLVLAGGHLLIRANPSRWAAYGIFLLAGLLKYYPVTLLILALRETPKQCLAVISIAGCVGGAFVFLYYPEVVASLANVPSGIPFGDMVGIVNLPSTIAIAISGFTANPGMPNPAISFSLRLVLTGSIVYSAARISQRSAFISSWAQLPTPAKTWLVIGCTVMFGCYILVQSVSYRLIYLLIVLSGLLAFRRVSTDVPVTNKITLAAILIVPAMWMEGIRHWADIAIQQFHIGKVAAYIIVTATWLFRELTWLYLATIMLSVVIQFVMHSPCTRRLVRNPVQVVLHNQASHP